MRILIILLLISLTGCTAMRVHEKTIAAPHKIVKQKGIPFYVKTAQIKQVTQYSRSWVEIKLDFSIIAPDGTSSGERSAKIFAQKKLFDLSGAYKAYDDAVLQLSNGFPLTLAAFRRSFSTNCACNLSQAKITAQSVANLSVAPDLHQTMISNRSEVVIGVDYNTKYYFNSKSPPFGTSSATIKLAADGTLTEATSTIDSTKFADLVPLKELLVDKLGLEDIVNPPVAVAAPLPTPKLVMSIESNGYYYKFTKFLPFKNGLNNSPLVFGGPTNIVRSEFSSAASKPPVDKDAIHISGSIKLPET